MEQTLNEFGRIDTLINNAGISMHARFDEILDVCLIEQIMRVNFLGSVYCTYFALPHLKQSKGRLVGVSSYGGKFPSPMASGYGASKHAMAGFFDSLRIELEDSGVSVTMTYFSWVTTGISSRAMGADGQPLGSALDHEANAMPVEDCGQLIIEAAAQRKREYIPLHGKIGLFMKQFFPKTIDRVSQDTLD
jgi:short-subunit dehydrogenase